MYSRILIALLISGSATWSEAFSLDDFIGGTREFPRVTQMNPAKTRLAVRAECSTSRLRDIMRYNSPRDAQNFISMCESQFEPRSLLVIAADILTRRIAIEKPERYRRMTFTLSTGETLQGLLALKETTTPLPLVIIRAGLYGQADYSHTNSQLLLNYFEHAPFHVLLLENPSNEDYVLRNRKIRFGGVSGGWQIMEVTKQLQRISLASRFLEYHLVGYSLGAHDALYANTFSTYDRGVKFNSVTALCPAIDLGPSVENVFRGQLIGSSNAAYLRNMLRRHRDHIPSLARTTGAHTAGLSRDEIRNVFINAAASELLTDQTMLPPPIGRRLHRAEEFLQLSRFQNFSDHIRTPTYVVQAINDSVTPFSVNLGSLRQRLNAHRNDYIHTLQLTRGEHCGFSQTMGFEWMSTLLTGIIARTSSMAMATSRLDFNTQLNRKPMLHPIVSRNQGYPIITDYQADEITRDPQTGQMVARIWFQYFLAYAQQNPRTNLSCRRFNYWDAPSECMIRIPTYVPADAIGLGGPFRTQQELNAALTRFNVVVSIRDSSGKEIIGTNKRPYFIEIPEKMRRAGFY